MLFQMLGVFSEFEREIIKERVNSGLARAKAQGKKLGRPRCDDPKLGKNPQAAKAEGRMLKIAKQLGVGTSVVRGSLACDLTHGAVYGWGLSCGASPLTPSK